MNRSKTILVIAMMLVAVEGKTETKVDTVNPVQPMPEITVYRSPTCTCCEKWVAHLKQNEFKVNDNVIDNVQGIKTKYGVSAEMASCHTALVDGYVVEGHVPADDIKQLLKTKPSLLGIAVPGMPMGTPGMEMGDKKDAYNVMSFDDKKQYSNFNSYPAQ